MNKLLLMMNLLILTPSVLGGVKFNNVPDPEVINAPQVVEIETSNVVYSYIKKTTMGRSLTSNVDFVGSDSSIIGVDGAFVNSLQGYKESPHRSIIGFNADVDSIDRITIKVNYNLYKNWDLFNSFPEERSKTFVINSNVIYSMYSNTYLENVVSNYSALGGYSALNPKMIGRVSELSDLQNNHLAVVPKKHNLHSWNNTQNNFIWNGRAYNQTFGKFIPFEESALNNREWYIIMPVGFDISRVWISIAYEKDDVYYGDGLDVGGIPFIIENDVKIISVVPKNIEYLYISDITNFLSITFVPDGNYNNTKVDFGFYSSKDNKIIDSLGSISFDSQLTYVSSELSSFLMLPDSNIGFSGNFGNGSVVIRYSSDGFITYMNVVSVDEDGNNIYMPIEETPIDSDDSWITSIKNFFGGLFDKFFAFIKIVMLIILIGISVWLITLLIKMFKGIKKEK